MGMQREQGQGTISYDSLWERMNDIHARSGDERTNTDSGTTTINVSDDYRNEAGVAPNTVAPNTRSILHTFMGLQAGGQEEWAVSSPRKSESSLSVDSPGTSGSTERIKLNLRLKRRCTPHRLTFDVDQLSSGSSDQSEGLSCSPIVAQAPRLPSPSHIQRQARSELVGREEHQKYDSSMRSEFSANSKLDPSVLLCNDKIEANDVATTSSKHRERLAMLTKFRLKSTKQSASTGIAQSTIRCEPSVFDQRTVKSMPSLMAGANLVRAAASNPIDPVSTTVLDQASLSKSVPTSQLIDCTQRPAQRQLGSRPKRSAKITRESKHSRPWRQFVTNSLSIQPLSPSKQISPVCLCTPLSLVRCNQCLRLTSLQILASVPDPHKPERHLDSEKAVTEGDYQGGDDTITDEELSDDADDTIKEMDVVEETSGHRGPSDKSNIKKERKRRTTLKEVHDATAAEVIRSCSSFGSSAEDINTKIFPVRERPLPPRLPPHLLNPESPSILVETEADAYSKLLERFTCSHPVCVIRNLAGAIRLDLGLFSSKSLVECNPDHRVEIRDQRRQMPYINVDGTDRRVWHCKSSRSQTTIAKYAEYQVNSFKMALDAAAKSTEETKTKTSESDSNSSVSQHDSNAGGPCTIADNRRAKTSIKFGTNVDLSDRVKWRPQLKELERLPEFAKVEAESNQLNYVGHKVLGVNTVQLYMKVPGSRTPGHQENCNYASVNINVGPGDCEWFCVPHEYWPIMRDMCEERGISYLTGSWWPDLNDLYDARIPLYRLVQKPGDLVWVAPGTVHWVQAAGWCNNIAWNVGPMNAHQYELAIERTEFYKTKRYRSIVPMIQLSWNIARDMRNRLTDRRLYGLIRQTLRASLRQCQNTLDYARSSAGKEIVWYGRTDGELAHYCEQCEIEVFNTLFVMEQPADRKYLVHCLSCALKLNAGLSKMIVLQQYNMSALMKIYDDFKQRNSGDEDPYRFTGDDAYHPKWICKGLREVSHKMRNSSCNAKLSRSTRFAGTG